MKKQLSVSYQGKVMTMRQAAKHAGVSYDTIRMRYLRGYRGEDLFKPVTADLSTSKYQVTYNGRTQSLRAWAKEVGISYDTLRMRYERGWRDSALFTPINEVRNKHRMLNASKYADLKKLAQEHNIPYDTVRNRYLRGWRGEALVQPKRDATKHYLTHNGKTQSLRAWAKELDMCYETIVMRIKRGMTDPAKILNPESYTRYDKNGQPKPRPTPAEPRQPREQVNIQA